MIDLRKYNLTDEDLEFLDMLKGDLEYSNENLLEYNGKIFSIEPCMDKIEVYTGPDIFETYEDFDDLLLNFKIDGVPMIELIKDIDFA